MIVILGAGGQVGSALMRLLGERGLAVTRTEMDLASSASIGPLLTRTRPDAVINCAAYTDVDRAESDTETARQINALAVERLARATADHRVRFVTYSTDYVFDGTKSNPYVESDEPNPLSVYGKTKLEGELGCLAVNPDALVIRTSWVVSATQRNFVTTMMDLIGRGQVAVVDDQRGRPTVADDLAQATLRCLETDATGRLHLTNTGSATWFQLARDIARLAKLDQDRVVPCSTEDFQRPAPRPANSMLDSERVEDLGLQPLPHYRESLERVVDQVSR